MLGCYIRWNKLKISIKELFRYKGLGLIEIEIEIIIINKIIIITIIKELTQIVAKSNKLFLIIYTNNKQKVIVKAM